VAAPLPPRAPKTPRVTATEVLNGSAGFIATMRPIDNAEGKDVRWTFRHPDLDGSDFTGGLFLAGVGRTVKAEHGYVTTGIPEERDALRRMGWVQWKTEVPDARIGISRAF